MEKINKFYVKTQHLLFYNMSFYSHKPPIFMFFCSISKFFVQNFVLTFIFCLCYIILMKNSRFVHDKRYSNYVIIEPISKFVSNHYHSQIEICYVLDGEMTITINGKSSTIKKDQMCIVDSFEEHSFCSEQNTKGIYFSVPDPYTAKFLSWTKKKKLSSNFILKKNITKKFKVFLDMLKHVKPDSTQSLYTEGLITTILGMILLYVPLEDDKEKNSNIVTEIVQYVFEHFSEKLTLEDVAKHFGYSKYYFSKIFNKNFKCHFNDFVNHVRCRNIIATLNSSPNQTILATILNSGFTSPSAFYKFFKDHYKIPPSQLKNEQLRKSISDIELDNFIKTE